MHVRGIRQNSDRSLWSCIRFDRSPAGGAPTDPAAPRPTRRWCRASRAPRSNTDTFPRVFPSQTTRIRASPDSIRRSFARSATRSRSHPPMAWSSGAGLPAGCGGCRECKSV